MILIDPPAWSAHGRLWSHLASDTSVEELHAFAERAGVPRRAFEGDHYDVPADRYDALVAAGAVQTSARNLLSAIVSAGLRRPRRRGEKILRTRLVDDYYDGAGPCRVDVISSGLPIPVQSSLPGWWIELRGSLVRVEDGERGWQLPTLAVGQTGGHALGYVRVRLLEQPRSQYRGPFPWVFQPARRPEQPTPGSWRPVREVTRRPGLPEIWPLIEDLERRTLSGRGITLDP